MTVGPSGHYLSLKCIESIHQGENLLLLSGQPIEFVTINKQEDHHSVSNETHHHRNKGTVGPNSQRLMSGTSKGKG